MKRFSVLLSTFEKEDARFLIESIESIYFQSTPPSEIILVKDGVLSAELEGAINYLEKKISILKVHGYLINKGLGFALNYGLEKCSNEIVFRMDTDDIAKPNRFELQLKIFEANNEYALIGSYVEEFLHTPGDLNRIRQVPTASTGIEESKNSFNPFNHMTVGFKKSIVQKVGGYIDMPGYEDYYLWLRVLNHNKGLNINNVLVNARIGNNMIARRHGIKMFIRELKFQIRIYSEGYIDSYILLKNILVRGLPRLLPIYFFNLLYKNILRTTT